MKSLCKIAIALLCFAALFYVTGTQELQAALLELTLPMVALLFLISGLLIWVSAAKWRLFLLALSPTNAVPSSARLFGLYLVGYFINLLAPSFIGGDAVRSYYAGKHSGQHAAAAATILERFTGIVAMSVLALLFMNFSSLVTWQVEVAVLVLVAGLVIVALTALSPKLLGLARRLPQGNRVVVHIERVQEGLHLARNNHGLLLRCMGLSFLFHMLTVVNTIVAGWAVGWEAIPASDLFVVLPLILLIGAIPISPSGLGIQEGAFFYFLQGIGATPGQALAIGLVLRAKSYVLAAVGGLVFLSLRRQVGSLQPLPVEAPSEQ